MFVTFVLIVHKTLSFLNFLDALFVSISVLLNHLLLPSFLFLTFFPTLSLTFLHSFSFSFSFLFRSFFFLSLSIYLSCFEYALFYGSFVSNKHVRLIHKIFLRWQHMVRSPVNKVNLSEIAAAEKGRQLKYHLSFYFFLSLLNLYVCMAIFFLFFFC
jgi:hypothetical protein